MIKKAVILMAALTLCALFLPYSAPADTTGSDYAKMDKHVLMQQVRTLFEQENFAELERIAGLMRAEKTASQSGWPVLSYYYNGFDIVVGSCDEIKSEEDFKKTFDIMDKWSQAYPGSITQRVAEAGIWLDYAWFARGGGYADTVTDEGWRLFGDRIKKAQELLVQAPSLSGDDCPQRYCYLLRVGRAQGWERSEFEKVFSEAIALDPVYYPSYAEKAVYLLPRWDGEDGDWQKFADESVTLTPPSEGTTAYVRVLIATYWYNEWQSFEAAGVSWPKMKQGFLDMQKNYPDSDLNLNYFAFFAAMANDRETADELYKRIGDKPNLEVWKTRKFYDNCRNFVTSDSNFQLSSPAGRGPGRLPQSLGSILYLARLTFMGSPFLGLILAACCAILV